MTPIEKNIIVVDEQGNQYEATYPNRAKGLVKNGRARFIDDHTICLACPPDIETEDNTMSKNHIQESTTTAVEQVPQTVTVAYILEQIAKIVQQTDHLQAILEELKKPASECCEEAINAATHTVACREETNRQLIAFYREIYADIKPPVKPLSPEQTAAELVAILKDPAADEKSKDTAMSLLSTYMLG